jgi:hypothetical protein
MSLTNIWESSWAGRESMAASHMDKANLSRLMDLKAMGLENP